MNNDESTPRPRETSGPRTVETMQLKIHDRDAEGVVTVELIDKDGYSRAFFADADQALSEMAEALARDDYEDRAPFPA
ncbi:hypothetical protein ACFSCW_03350 [Sphingomonas tabacisoli]|uniref:Uncharacterized protein n=1 Tax=Sphingomonas tabacisoli TaxID=2249466 RepID=A0ABW4I171_9SPHN